MASCVALTVLCLGCGGGSDGGNGPAKMSTQPKPAAAVDTRPRVSGLWRVVYRPKDYSGETVRATWRIVPSCATGPCTFKARSSRKFTFDAFRFDKAIGDYTYSERDFLQCATGSGAIQAQRGYAQSRQITLQVTASTKSGTRRIATRMRGIDTSSYRTTKKGSLAGCSDEPKQTDRVIAVRLHP